MHGLLPYRLIKESVCPEYICLAKVRVEVYLVDFEENQVMTVKTNASTAFPFME